MAETLTMPNKSAPAAAEPATERKVSVKLLSDVWVPNPDVVGGIERIMTNIPVRDELGNIQLDPKSKTVISTQTIADLPLSIAKVMIDQGKALRMDPL